MGVVKNVVGVKPQCSDIVINDMYLEKIWIKLFFKIIVINDMYLEKMYIDETLFKIFHCTIMIL